MGLVNAAKYANTRSGWAYISFRELFEMKDAWAVHFGTIPTKVLRSPIWEALPFVRHNRLVHVPPTYQYIAGLPTIERLARTLGEALKSRS